MSFIRNNLRRAGRLLVRLSDDSAKSRSADHPTGIIDCERMGFHWCLNMKSCVARALYNDGVWEPDTTSMIQSMVKPGMHVLDIGANFGYFTVQLARLVGPTGKVWAFEPVAHYRDLLQHNIAQNQLANIVRIVPLGLSDKMTMVMIAVDGSTATLHSPSSIPPDMTEEIELHQLDNVASALGISRIDFIKIDVDGHEPAFLRGAEKTLRRHKPAIALEFAQHCLHMWHCDVREQARILKDYGYIVCREKTQRPYDTEMDFLMDCGNFDHSGNALAVHESRVPR